MPTTYQPAAGAGQYSPATVVFNVTDILNASPTVVPGVPFVGPTMYLAGLNAFTLWLKTSDGGAAGTIAAYMLELIPSSPSAAFSTVTTGGQILQLFPTTRQPGVAVTWQSFRMDTFTNAFAGTTPTVNMVWGAIQLVAAGGFNCTVSDAWMFARPA